MEAKSENLKIKFGERLRTLRIERNLSQEKLAALAETDKSWISEVELAKRDIQLTSIGKLADALEISLKELLDFDF
ncbi:MULTISPECIES: helix-turn-helix domain-containing protein [Mucilaginibacter]|uniref:Helix-turn-helix transcriptional regulator n=1 Tax=Mucilaginibacter rubeus TaxID=2027860 RepID=A0ABX7U3T2_9SPHI|nr:MULTISPECIES: helix-turn-helix transcriptional regulator [Mucilaginibacter]QTE40911.1 helix-turn-helix transcriptional regulator [Mucilaginibacter rubeus]QTE47514.1 helix-turn-helix transcriptional regulator [Mucilaginibacter rubeus]QTE58906.1 helix-turn-helix transcriptional regulator [Mucilaginibacter rubeus]QTE61635.1 helix-turn-helix transcriptional regulator [Mucilaginibacter rubeus]QTF60391.1 helix-turn-helix transcriptional regulator [Mucilaginibacter rubeus]